MDDVNLELERTEKGWLGQALVLQNGRPAYLAESIFPAPNFVVRDIAGREWFRTSSYRRGSGPRWLGQGGVTYRRSSGEPVRLDHFGLLGFRLKLYVGDRVYPWVGWRSASYPWMECSIPLVHGAFKARVTDPSYLDVAVSVLYYAWCRSDTAD